MCIHASMRACRWGGTCATKHGGYNRHSCVELSWCPAHANDMPEAFETQADVESQQGNLGPRNIATELEAAADGPPTLEVAEERQDMSSPEVQRAYLYVAFPKMAVTTAIIAADFLSRHP